MFSQFSLYPTFQLFVKFDKSDERKIGKPRFGKRFNATVHRLKRAWNKILALADKYLKL